MVPTLTPKLEGALAVSTGPSAGACEKSRDANGRLIRCRVGPGANASLKNLYYSGFYYLLAVPGN